MVLNSGISHSYLSSFGIKGLQASKLQSLSSFLFSGSYYVILRYNFFLECLVAFLTSIRGGVKLFQVCGL